jgi:DUF2975 family protein
MKDVGMVRGSTIILRGAIILIGLTILAVCIFALPVGISSDKTGYLRPIFISLYITAIPFFFALYRALKLLNYIDKNRAFSQDSVNALRHIKYCAAIISGLFALGLPYLSSIAHRVDPPVGGMGFVIVFASFVIATAAALFEKLFQNAIDIKSENDLTV